MFSIVQAYVQGLYLVVFMSGMRLEWRPMTSKPLTTREVKRKTSLLSRQPKEAPMLERARLNFR
jgi:hypothetical protein